MVVGLAARIYRINKSQQRAQIYFQNGQANINIDNQTSQYAFVLYILVLFSFDNTNQFIKRTEGDKKNSEKNFGFFGRERNYQKEKKLEKVRFCCKCNVE